MEPDEAGSAIAGVGMTPDVLRRRYMLALGIVALVLVSSHAVMHRMLNEQEGDAEVINISGQQRMLSQRIALDVLRLDADPVASVELDASIERMRGNAVFLRGQTARGDQHTNVTWQALDETESYLSLVDELVSAHRREHHARFVQLQSEVQQTRSALLNQLDDAVGVYQRIAEEHVSRFKRTSWMLLLFGLLVLVAEAVWVFRPATLSLRKTLDELTSTNRELELFTYRVSHDFRAPIASMKGLVGLTQALLEEDDRAEAERALQLAEGSLERMDTLIDNVTDLLRARSGAMTTPVEDVHIGAMVHETITSLAHLPGAERVRIEVNVHDQAAVLVKRQLLRQLVENLISNAIKYQDPNEPQPFIDVTSESSGGETTLSVRDNGRGIPPDLRDSIFEMFSRCHPDAAPGSGLGLYVCKQIAATLHGELRYEPQEVGSLFTLRFPTKGME